MALTPQQLPALKAAIRAETNPEFVGYRTGGATGAMAAWFNAEANPAFVVWKTSVPTSDIGKAMNMVAFAAMTDANQGQLTRFYTLYPGSFDPARSDVRGFFANTLSGALGGQGQATRDAMEAMYRRNATRGEKVFATGTGSFASPGVAAFVGSISNDDIVQALAV